MSNLLNKNSDALKDFTKEKRRNNIFIEIEEASIKSSFKVLTLEEEKKFLLSLKEEYFNFINEEKENPYKELEPEESYKNFEQDVNKPMIADLALDLIANTEYLKEATKELRNNNLLRLIENSRKRAAFQILNIEEAKFLLNYINDDLTKEKRTEIKPRYR